MTKIVRCQCGDTIQGKDDDELVANVQQHAKTIHGGMQVSREQVLAMAEPA